MSRIVRLALPCLVLVALCSPASAAPRPGERVAGFVDGSAFAELAGEDDEIVEVNLGPSMLSALARGAAAEDPEDASILDGLTSVTAYVLTLRDGADGRFQRAMDLVKSMEARLEREGWERLARVRDGKERVNVFVLNGKETIEGLTVMVLDGESHEIVFANLAGAIDLARLGDLGHTLSVPGLDAVKSVEETATGEGK